MPTPPYAPADASLTLPALDFLHSTPGEQLRAHITTLLAANATLSVADIAALRKSHPPDIVHAALTLAQLQKKARLKFPDLPFTWAVPEALEQATDAAVAAHKAARFAGGGAAKPDRILDLCAGIGGDTMALAKIAPVTACDLSPIRTTCLRYNLESLPPKSPVDIRTEDVHTLLQTVNTAPSEYSVKKGGNIANTPHTPWQSSPATTLFHIDPARRNAGKRSARFEDLIPGPDLLLPLIQSFPGGAIKLSPAIDFDTLPSGHLELISHNRSVVQAVLWTGTLAPSTPHPPRTATLLLDGHPPFSYAAHPTHPTITPTPATFLFEADPALTRASLAAPFAASLDLAPLTIDAGYLTGPTLLKHPALVPFRIILTLPYSQERVTAALSHLPPGDHGPVEVKTRGALPGINTDQLQLIWSAATPSRRTVLIYRHHDQVVATIADRA